MGKELKTSLSDPLSKWVNGQAAKKGYGSAGQFVVEVLRPEKAMEAREQIDALLIESLNSGPSTPTTRQDRKEIRQAGKRRSLGRQKN
jgi:antitoxin ParD1/3/4